jgi:histidinol-phosphate aminotransferase
MSKQLKAAPTTRLVAGLPATVPFVAPEALERATGRRFILRLGANESNFGPSPRAREAMRAAVDSVYNYGDPESYDLRAALARHHGVSIENVVVGSGIDDLLGLVVRTFLERGETAVTSLGAYPTFNYHVAGFGGSIERIPYRDDGSELRNDLDALAAAAQRTGARLIYLANPDNPSGSWYTSNDLAAFLDRLPETSLLLLDEAYIDFAPAAALLPIDAGDPRLIRLRTFSKAHGMAGARIGYAIATPETIAAFDKVRLHFGVNSVAQTGALAAIQDSDHLTSVVAAVAAGRRDYETLARELDLAPLPCAANFVTIDVGAPARATALVAALAARDVFIRMPGAPPLDRCVRVTVGTPPERALFAEILREVWPAIAAHPA